MNQVCKTIKNSLNVHRKNMIENRLRHMKSMSQNVFSASFNNSTLQKHCRAGS